MKLSGRVFNIVNDQSYLQIFVIDQQGNEDAFVIDYSITKVPAGIYKNTYVTIYGEVSGSVKGSNAFGGDITQPEIVADIIEKQ